jgi:hypothetical protein
MKQMVFKKFDEQKVYQVSVNPKDSHELEVGAMIAVDTAKDVSEITTIAQANEALAANKTLYIIAQSDAVTDKTGTAYKSYDMSRMVTLNAATPAVIAAYKVTDLENVEGLEA